MNPPIKNSTIGSPTALAMSDGGSTPDRGNKARANSEVTGMGMVSKTHHVTIQRVMPSVRAESI